MAKPVVPIFFARRPQFSRGHFFSASRSTDREKIGAARSLTVALCSCARHFSLTVPLFPQRYKWSELLGKLNHILKVKGTVG